MYRGPNIGGGGRCVLGLRSTPSGVYDGKIAGLYDLEETLGRGHFAIVKLARHVFTGEKVAVKVIDKSKLDEVSKAHLFQEVRCMKLVQHPNVVRLYEVIDTATKLYLILELGDGGDLYDYIMRHESGLSEQLAKDYFRQIVRAISYCHQLHVVHRDLKPENVVFFEKLGIVKLTDFGFSNKFCPGQKLETSCGSLAYSAPEILLGDSYDAPAVDVWSLGVILYMLVCGHAPFQEANDSETLTMIMDCKYSVPSYISKECKDLISKMLVRDPEKRATLSQISQHPWLSQNKEDTNDILPLVSREQLSDEDHNIIVQKIVNGNIATKEEIQESIDKNAYNHITATYYLLAERKLRAKRQEQVNVNKKRPENLLVNQNLNRSNGSSNVTPCLLSVPRTPGDLPQRSRKCSIVQEDEEEEDLSGREDSQTHGSLNRRGSRSEGRLNLIVQGCLNEKEFKSEERKLESQKSVLRPFVNTSNINSYKKLPCVGNQHGAQKWSMGKSNSIPQHVVHKPKKIPDIVPTCVLNESSTISIPVVPNTPYPTQKLTPKFKTMPSPTRPSPPVTSPLQLNEIFEEGDGTEPQMHHVSRDIVTRNQKRASYEHKRSKFNKARTASCSSSDASDEDSENRNKRAHKFHPPNEKPPIRGRRDSHDDSSDSQEPGSGGTGTAGSSLKPTIVTQTTHETSTKNSNNSNSSNNNSTNTSSGRKSCFNSNDTNLMKKHKILRRRNGETRLRESQSLNRISEVQEEVQSVVLTTTLTATQGVITAPKSRGFGARIWHGLTSVTKSSVEEKNEKTRKQYKITQLDVKEDLLGKKKTLIEKYLQVHRKLSIPLPDFLTRHRLYKAQSCSSLANTKTHPVGQKTRAKSVVRSSDVNTYVTFNEITGICKEHLGHASKCCSFC